MLICLVQDVIHDGALEPCFLPKHTHVEYEAPFQRRTSHVTMKLTNADVRIHKSRSKIRSAQHTSFCDGDSVTAQSDAAA